MIPREYTLKFAESGSLGLKMHIFKSVLCFVSNTSFYSFYFLEKSRQYLQDHFLLHLSNLLLNQICPVEQLLQELFPVLKQREL
jgi:hypothetical protein